MGNKIYLILGILALFVIPFSIFVVVPGLTILPSDFSYEANMVSVDNFYDEGIQDYSGEQLSDTIFSYEVVEEKDGVLVIKNIFDVRTLKGEEIFMVERLYDIDRKTGGRITEYGEEQGYLFAPKLLKRGQDYTYLNYNDPVDMIFQEEEEILGLKVYRYELDYHDDQTEDFGHLEGVPEERGVGTDINLQIWIEPTTGRLIKYHDSAISYFYDIKTKERIFPRNKFYNKYTYSSVEEQVGIAKREKFVIILFRTVLPILLIILALILFVAFYVKIKKTPIPENQKKEGKVLKRMYATKLKDRKERVKGEKEIKDE